VRQVLCCAALFRSAVLLQTIAQPGDFIVFKLVRHSVGIFFGGEGHQDHSIHP
jgi:hypothetical protein